MYTILLLTQKQCTISLTIQVYQLQNSKYYYYGTFKYHPPSRIPQLLQTCQSTYTVVQVYKSPLLPSTQQQQNLAATLVETHLAGWFSSAAPILHRCLRGWILSAYLGRGFSSARTCLHLPVRPKPPKVFPTSQGGTSGYIS